MDSNLNKSILEKISFQNEHGGIDVHDLKVGTCILVDTSKGFYKIKVIDGTGKVEVECGEFFAVMHFIGSNFGGSMLKVGWIGKDMYMEFRNEENFMISTAVKKAKVITDDWQYIMEWN